LRREQVPVFEKTKAVLRLLRGDSVETLSSEMGVSVRRLERWKDEFIAGGSDALAKRKDVGSPGWWSKNSAAIWQWTILVIGLILAITVLAHFTQRD
jgi:transposase